MARVQHGVAAGIGVAVVIEVGETTAILALIRRHFQLFSFSALQLSSSSSSQIGDGQALSALSAEVQVQVHCQQ